jgi:hypothetical protein
VRPGYPLNGLRAVPDRYMASTTTAIP